MRIRFSIKTALLAMTLIAAGLVFVLFAYRNYLVPHTPLSWEPFNATCLETIGDTQRPILISIRDTTLTMSPDLQHVLEYDFIEHHPNTEFRTFVYDNDVQLYTFEHNWHLSTGQDHADAVKALLWSQYPDMEHTVNLPPFLLALPGQDRVLFFHEPSPDAYDIMAAVLTNGETLSGEDYFPDRY